MPDCERIESQIRPAAPDGDPAAIDDGDEAETDLDDEPEPTGSIWERARACEDIAGVWGARGACDGCGTKPPTLRIHVRADCRFGAEDVGSLKHQVGGVVDPASGGLHIAGGALDAHTYKLVLQGNGLTGTWLGGHDQRVRTMRGGKGWEPPRQRRTPLAALQRMAESQLEGTVQLPAIRTLREIRSYGTEAACDYLIGLSVTDLLRHRFWDNRHTILTEGVGCRGETLPKSP